VGRQRVAPAAAGRQLPPSRHQPEWPTELLIEWVSRLCRCNLLCLPFLRAYGGELFDRILKTRAFSEKDVVNLSRKLFHAVAYLHSRGIIHRDLKVPGARGRHCDGAGSSCIVV